MEKKDIIIASLEYVKEKSLKGEPINQGDLADFLIKSNYMKADDSHFRDFVYRFYLSIASTAGTGINTGRAFIGLDAYLGLLDYEELQQARKDSQEARREAKKATYIAVASLILGAIIGFAGIVVQICYR